MRKRTPFAHAGQPMRSRAAQQFQQHRFHLIVAVMRQGQPLAGPQALRERCVPRVPRGGLQPLAAASFNLHANDFDRHIQRFAKERAMFRPASAVFVQAMVHVQRPQSAPSRLRCVRQRVQQRGGVRPAGKAHAQRTRGIRIQCFLKRGNER